MDRTLATRCDYVKTTPDQRGPLGRWLTRVREERYRTQPQALAAYRRLAGLVISESEYAQWESGSRVPRPDNPKLLRLFEFYGSRPEDPEPEREQAGGAIGRCQECARKRDRSGDTTNPPPGGGG